MNETTIAVLAGIAVVFLAALLILWALAARDSRHERRKTQALFKSIREDKRDSGWGRRLNEAFDDITARHVAEIQGQGNEDWTDEFEREIAAHDTRLFDDPNAPETAAQRAAREPGMRQADITPDAQRRRVDDSMNSWKPPTRSRPKPPSINAAHQRGERRDLNDYGSNDGWVAPVAALTIADSMSSCSSPSSTDSSSSSCDSGGSDSGGGGGGD